MKIGDKFKQGYELLEAGEWKGIFLVYEAVTNLYELDAIDEKIYDVLTNYVRSNDMTGSDTEASQWIKILLMDSRYAGLLLKAGDLLENLTEVLNKFPELPDDVVTDCLMEGQIKKAKYVRDTFFYIERDAVKNQSFLVKRKAGVTTPVDFDVEDFTVDRTKERIEYHYSRGNKDIISVNYDGEDKKGGYSV